MNGLGHRVRIARSKLGISQRELGRRAEISSAYMSFIERDLRHPSIEMVEKLAKILKVGPGFLAFGKEK